jgi:hypothetical protein
VSQSPPPPSAADSPPGHPDPRHICPVGTIDYLFQHPVASIPGRKPDPARGRAGINRHGVKLHRRSDQAHRQTQSLTLPAVAGQKAVRKSTRAAPALAPRAQPRRPPRFRVFWTLPPPSAPFSISFPPARPKCRTQAPQAARAPVLSAAGTPPPRNKRSTAGNAPQPCRDNATAPCRSPTDASHDPMRQH